MIISTYCDLIGEQLLPVLFGYDFVRIDDNFAGFLIENRPCIDFAGDFFLVISRRLDADRIVEKPDNLLIVAIPESAQEHGRPAFSCGGRY